MKKKTLVSLLLLMLVILSACASSSIQRTSKQDSGTKAGPTTKVDKPISGNQEVEEVAISTLKKEMSKIYSVPNLDVDLNKSYSVTRIPSDENSDTGEKYNNITTAMFHFAVNGKDYNATIIYNLSDDKKTYNLLYLDSNLDHSKTFNIPLKNDQ